jgi:hypothetical protein
MSLLNRVAHVLNAPARFAQEPAEIVDTAGFCVGFVNSALVGTLKRLRQVQAAGVFGN